ncbi:MAG: glycosyltransferase family 39 protein [Anaerolineae bacterium]|nr:glycosyltransferase family 39 protein [Anaerolineae bacterium]
MVHRARRWVAVGLVLLFLLAFVPRVVYPVSRPLQWYFRSAQFFQAVLRGDLAGTLFSEHPGVTVMWLSGAALWGWYGLQSLLGLNPPTPLETEGYAFFDRVTVAVVPLALVVALGIVWGWYLLRRLFGQRVAWVAAVLWAVDPFYLANSKALHLDATLSTLMLLSALWMLTYLREHRWRYLVLSATLGGLAILTKISAVFLFPFWGLCLLVDWLPSIRGFRSLISNLGPLISRILLWLLIAAAVFFVRWPALWVQPAASFDWMINEGILLHKDDVRDQPLFYRGTLGVQDPGPGFYLDTILFRTTFLTLPFVVVGLLALWGRQREERLSLLLVGFAAFFFVQMSLSGWKDGRYLLPIFLILDILAACGLTWWAGRLPLKSLVQMGVVGGLLTTQAIVVFLHHPYYGTHYNVLLGGQRAAERVFPLAEWGEGLDLAGRYVDSQPGAEDFTIGTQFLANEMLAQHVRAPVYEVRQVKDEAEYLVFGVQYTTRGRNYDRWGEEWEETYRFREPEFVAAFDGIPYAWVYRPDAAPVVPRKMDASLGGAIRLVGYRLAQDSVAPGDKLVLTLYWRAEGPVDEYYNVFVHLQAADGSLVAQQDNVPVRGSWPTNEWEMDVLIEDPYEVQVPLDRAPAECVLSVGMYKPTTMERLEAVGADGERLPEDRVVLTNVSVQPVVGWWRWVFAGAWVAVVFVGIVWPLVLKNDRHDGTRCQKFFGEEGFLQGIGKAERICLAVIVVGILVYLYWYGAVIRIREANVDMTRADQRAYLLYAVEMYKVLHEGKEFRSQGAQGPLYPMLLSLVYDPSLTEEEYFVRGKYVSAGLSLILLGGLFFIFRKHFSLLHSANIVLAEAFMVFLFKAPSFHAEPLFYFWGFCAFVLLYRMLVKPSWKLGVLTGFVIGIAHFTKPSLLPALGLFLLFSVAKAIAPLCSRLVKRSCIALGQFDVRVFSSRLVSIVLVAVTFLSTVYPYINSNKKVFGKYFYCVSTTFYMWYDSWEEAKQGTKAYGDREGWPDMPPEQLPSLDKYLREHTVQQIVNRVWNGFRILHQSSASSYGYYKYVLIYLVGFLAMAILNRRHTLEMAAKRPFLLLFCLSYFAAYLFAYAWYTPIASGNRFTLALFLPFMFAISRAIFAQPTVYLPVRPFGVQIKLLNVLNALVLALLFFDIYGVLTEKVLTM